MIHDARFSFELPAEQYRHPPWAIKHINTTLCEIICGAKTIMEANLQSKKVHYQIITSIH
jgi:hypothetical protein